MVFPTADVVILRDILVRHAKERPDAICVQLADGTEWSWSMAVEVGERGAAALHARGIGSGDPVLVFLSDAEQWLRAWFAVSFLGAVLVPVHVAHRSAMLRHTCVDSGGRCIIATGELADRVVDLDIDLPIVAPSELQQQPNDPAPTPELAVWDIALINYTSGTTGPAKGVLTTHFQSYMSANAMFGAESGMTAEDKLLVTLPLFHSAGQQLCVGGWSVGAAAAVEPAFSATKFWQRLVETGATRAILVGVMGNILMSQDPTELDRAHKVRYLVSCPYMNDPAGFSERFGIPSIVTGLGSTEMGAVLLTRPGDEIVVSSCGRAREEAYEVQLFDDHDIPVPVGEVGEMVLRPRLPWMSLTGYLNRPEATAAAWRNGWYHSGDLMRRDEAGNFYFVDRRHDVLRRKGENISSFEVEAATRSHPAVLDAACVAVSVENGEPEVKVFIVSVGVALDPEELIEHLVERLPSFAVPRYVEFVAEMPMTHSGKVQKFELRGRLNGPATWDRVAAGLVVTSAGLQRTDSSA